ncbi:MAG: LysE family translocator [Ignavibacteria bacterium]|nr:LysE family translocator [Ignavibacteria bacterium]
MIEFDYIFKGAVLGFSVAAPVGPIGILCINRTINKNFLSGFVSGLGAATADLVYGLITGLGLTVVSDFMIHHKLPLQIVGVLFLLYLAVKTLVKKEKRLEYNSAEGLGLWKDYLSTLALTITNPVTILFFLAVFAGVGILPGGQNLGSLTLFLVGIFGGSCVWWLFLSGLTEKLKTRINTSILRKIDLVSGMLMLFFCLMIVWGIIRNVLNTK